jgi:Holliday junction resolvase RusA-like endonuclease
MNGTGNSGKVTCEIDMKLPSLNDYVRVCRSNAFQASSYKKRLENEIGYFIAKLPRFEHPIQIHFHWIEGNKRRDLDNIAFSKKFILDAMVKAGKLKDDNRRFVTAFTDTFSYGDSTKVILTIEELEESDGEKTTG